uniref:CAZy families GT4 protein n=1 Tax=uncultured Cronobacter sp. TaxID=574120 RepID=A0A060C8Z4_9ENTR|nr:CAZy families GT4 protein [uncultured Cronobacter sp.]
MKRYGNEARNLILSAVCGGLPEPVTADVFIAHFGPAGVSAAKLRELGALRGKIATVSMALIFPTVKCCNITPRNTSNC